MPSQRKYVRLALTDEDQKAVAEAKRQVEDATGITMSDSMFLLSLIRKAVIKSG